MESLGLECLSEVTLPPRFRIQLPELCRLRQGYFRAIVRPDSCRANSPSLPGRSGFPRLVTQGAGRGL